MLVRDGRKSLEPVKAESAAGEANCFEKASGLTASGAFFNGCFLNGLGRGVNFLNVSVVVSLRIRRILKDFVCCSFVGIDPGSVLGEVCMGSVCMGRVPKGPSGASLCCSFADIDPGSVLG